MTSTGFDWNSRTRLVFGSNSVDRIGEFARDLAPNGKVLLVTDPGIVTAGHAGRVRGLLETAGCTVTVFDRVRENPTTRTVDECVAVARAAGIELIIGLGGGSSLDTAKGCNFILTNGGRMQDYRGIGKATQPMLPLIAVPTTAGTGSECQSFALIADEQTHQKMACGDPKAAARVAILDPLLTLTQPRAVAASTGIDAVAHAIETGVTRKRNVLSWVFSREALRLTIHNLPIVLEQPDHLAARSAMLLGAAWSGMAIETSMLGAAHSAANPLTAHYGIVHGIAVGLMLPHVIQWNAGDRPTKILYDELAESAGIEGVDGLVARLGALLAAAGISPQLRDHGVERGAILDLAREAAGQWTATFNPRAITAEDFEKLYGAAF